MARSNRVTNAIVAVFAVATAVLGYMMLRGETDEVVTDPRPRQSAPDPPAEPPRKPDVIFITVDTLRVDRLHSYGYDEGVTKSIDKLATEGIRFEQATVPFPRTTPALASLFTGLWPHHHGSREVWERITRGPRLAEVLTELGYDTIGVSSNSAAGSRQSFDDGFRQFKDRKQLGRHDADKVTHHALALLENVDPDKPLFLWAHYVDPHWPYQPPRSFKRQPRGAKCRTLRNKTKRNEIPLAFVLSNVDGIAEDALEDCSALYDAEIQFADWHIGDLLDGLEHAGRLENAIVVFTSDHGENMGEDAYWFGHGPSVHDASMRVPLIVVGPGVPAGKVDDSVTRIEDVMPTILDMLDVPRDTWPTMDGVSFEWRWNPDAPRPKQPVEVALAESGTPLRALSSSHLVSGRHGQYCIHDERYSICHEREQREPEPPPAPSERGEGDDDEDDDDDDDDDDDKRRANPKDEGPPTAASEKRRVSAAVSTRMVDRIYDRQKDPEFAKPLARPPKAIKARLEKAMETWKPETARQRTARTPEFKLVDYPLLEGGYRRELYDLTTDPGATKNVADEHPKEARALGDLLERWATDVPLYEARERTDEEIEELRALGYVR